MWSRANPRACRVSQSSEQSQAAACVGMQAARRHGNQKQALRRRRPAAAVKRPEKVASLFASLHILPPRASPATAHTSVGMSSSRSATVHALSGRVQGLKFMQRATAAASRSAAEPASQDAPATPGPSRTPAVDSPQASTPAQQTQLAADDDEHWVLPSAGAPASATPSAARIQHEPAWDSWLLASTSASPAGAGSRRTFGSWAKKKSAAAEQAAEEEEMDEQEREGMKIVEELKSEPVRRKSKEKKRSAALAVEDGSVSRA